MESKNKITVHEKTTKKKKGISVSYFRTVKTSGTPEAAQKAVETLKKNRSNQFEVRNQETGRKTVYKKLINSTIYEIKVC